MTVRRLTAMMVLAALALSGAPRHAAAQTSPLGMGQPSIPPPITPAPPRGRIRIPINPPALLYRRCVDWYELQYRPSGTVLYPQKRCWWVRG
jgi:hypothetical protein